VKVSPRLVEENQRLRDERRKQIMQTAVDIFARRGLAATKISDIAKAVGMSQGLVYHYFSSKEELFDAIVEQGLHKSIGLAKRTLELELSPWEKLEYIASYMVGSITEQPQGYMIVIQASASETTSAPIKELLVEHGNLYRDTFRRLVIEGQELGQVAEGDPDELVTLFFLCFQGLALELDRLKQAPISKVTASTLLRILKPR
jgi:AcrR family transcriptional regulator